MRFLKYILISTSLFFASGCIETEIESSSSSTLLALKLTSPKSISIESLTETVEFKGVCDPRMQGIHYKIDNNNWVLVNSNLSFSCAQRNLKIDFANLGTEMGFTYGVTGQSGSIQLRMGGAKDKKSDPLTIQVAYNPPNGRLTFSEGTDFDYGNVVNSATLNKNFVVTNSGTKNVSSITVSGLAAPFTLGTDTCSGNTITPTNTCQISVSFNPTTSVFSEDTLVIDYNDTNAMTSSSINLDGTGSSPATLEISDGPSTYDFGNFVNGTTNSKTFMVSNTGNVDATSVTGSGLAAPFIFKGGGYPGTGGTCGTSIAAGANCSIVVDFTPFSAVTLSDTIDLGYNNGLSVVNSTRNIQGTGTNPANLVIAPASYNFSNVTTVESGTQIFSVNNTGDYSASFVSEIGLSAPYSFTGTTGYPGTAGTCGTTITQGSTCNIEVQFKPTTTGAFADQIELSYNDGANTVTATSSLTGNGIPPIAPSAPAGVTLSISNPNELTVNWAASGAGTNPITYNILRSTTPGVGHTAIASGISGTTYVDSSTVGGTTYYYIVQASGPGGNTNSTEASGAPLSAFSLTAATAGDLSVNLSWATSAGATSYSVDYGTTSGTHGTNATAAGTSPYDVTGLTAGVTYYFKVTAFNGTGSLVVSNELSAEPYTVPVKIARGHQANANCAIMSNGQLKCWGNSIDGILGNGADHVRGDSASDTGDNATIVNLGTGRSISQFSTSLSYSPTISHTCAILDNGALKCWGDNGYGQLGYGDRKDRGGPTSFGDSLPAVDLGSGITATQVSAGEAHTCIIDNNNNVRCWGYGAKGRLGNGATSYIGDGAGEMGDNLAVVDLGTGHTAIQVAAGSESTCAILNDRKVKCWGSTYRGQIGTGTDATNQFLGDGTGEMGDNLPYLDLGIGRTANQISAGNDFYCALLDNGGVKCWGEGSLGRLGQDDTLHKGDDPSEMGDNLPPIDLGTGASYISAGLDHACAVLTNGSVKCWGEGGSGSLGQESPSDFGNNDGAGSMSLLPPIDIGTGKTALSVSAGNRTTCVHRNDDTAVCWGENLVSQTGNLGSINVGNSAGEMGDNLTVFPIGTGQTVASVHASHERNCVVRDDGQAICYGKNNAFSLGIGLDTIVGNESGEMGQNLIPVNLGSGKTAVDVALGFQHACAILDDGSVKCWGGNKHGQLGYEDKVSKFGSPSTLPTVNLGGSTATKITAGYYHTCALLTGGQVKCWGYNNQGQLGLDIGNNDFGGNPGQMSGLAAVNLPESAAEVSAGIYHTCARLTNGNVMCWGDGGNGQLGVGSTFDYGDNIRSISSLPALDLGTGKTATAISSGGYFSCALLNDSSVKCWGQNTSGQLGLGITATKFGDSGGEMGDALNPVNLGTGMSAKEISSGDLHVCALLNDDSVKCWGEGSSGRLGQGSPTSDIGKASSSMGDNLPGINFGTGVTVKKVNATNGTTCVITNSDKMLCLGYNLFGELGIEGTTTQGGSGTTLGNALIETKLW